MATDTAHKTGTVSLTACNIYAQVSDNNNHLTALFIKDDLSKQVPGKKTLIHSHTDFFRVTVYKTSLINFLHILRSIASSVDVFR